MEVVGVMVTNAVPRFEKSFTKLVNPAVVACGNVTATAAALVNVVSFPLSAVRTV